MVFMIRYYDRVKDTGMETVDRRESCDLLTLAHLKGPHSLVAVVAEIPTRNSANSTMLIDQS